VWPFYFTIDEQRGLIYLPLASPIPAGFGGDRKGANLFGNSVVAVDVQTGKYKWHFQTIHHDLWDHDPPAPPGLFDVVMNGRTIPALGVTTKSGYLYILNRENGRPIFGVEERPMPKSDVPWRIGVSNAADPGETAGAGACVLHRRGSGDGCGHNRRARQGVRGLDREDRRGVQRRALYAMEVQSGRRIVRGHTLVSRARLAARTGAATAFDPASRFLFVVTQDVGALGSAEKTEMDRRCRTTRRRPGAARLT
jgi:hypothetical protein